MRHTVHGLIAGATMVLAMSTALAAAPKEDFPRLAGYLISAPQNYDDPTYQAKIAKLDLAILSVWPHWGADRGTTMDATVRAIKAKNPNELVFLYLDINELQNPAPSTVTEVQNKLNDMKWWLYPYGGSGASVKSGYGTNYYQINLSPFSPADSSGDRWMQWNAKWVVNNYYKTAPAIDGFYTDNVFTKPLVDGDWNRDGKVDSKDDPLVGTWTRQGYKQHFDALKSLMPGKYQIGNMVEWGRDGNNITEYQGMLNGGVLEGMIGYSYSPEAWGSWSMMMSWYHKAMTAAASPKMVVLHQGGSATDYQGMRYGLASALMDDGYYFYALNKVYTGVAWFDEFDVKLGKALAGPSNSAWQKGVYRRNFENGIALVNPRGNGAVDVQLETDFVHISGKQVPAINDGKTVRTVHLNDRDGIILLRVAPTARPKAPILVAP